MKKILILLGLLIGALTTYSQTLVIDARRVNVRDFLGIPVKDTSTAPEKCIGELRAYPITGKIFRSVSCTADKKWEEIGSGVGGGVTSVALSLPGSIFSVSGSPVTSTGTLTGTLTTQLANTAFLGPTTGSAAAPTFRALVEADIPTLPWAKVSKVGSSLGDLATRSATDLNSGTLADARLSSNVPLKNAANVFTQTNTFAGLIISGLSGTGSRYLGVNGSNLVESITPTDLSNAGGSGLAILFERTSNDLGLARIIANNGLTSTQTNDSLGTIVIGGNLLQTTTINKSGFDFSILGNGGFLARSQSGNDQGNLATSTTSAALQYANTSSGVVTDALVNATGATISYQGTTGSDIKNGVESNVSGINIFTDIPLTGGIGLRVLNGGFIVFTSIPTYANDAAAGTGGLTTGYVYQTATGELRIKL